MDRKQHALLRWLAVFVALAAIGTACSRGDGLEQLRKDLERQQQQSPDPSKADHVKPPPEANPNLTGRVGLIVATNSESWQRLTEAPDTEGVVVLFVQPGGPSDGLGLQRGDVVTEVNGEPSRNAERAVYMLRAEPGAERTIAISKRGDGSTDEITIPAAVPGPVDLRALYGPLIEENPDDAVLRFLRAQTVSGLEEAIGDLDAALDLAPGFVEALSLRGELRWNEARLGGVTDEEEIQRLREQAMSDWGLALELDPANTRVLASRSQAHSQLGSWRQGGSDAEAALEADDSFPIAHYAFGLAELVSGSAEDAAEPVRLAIDLNPFDVRYYELLAVTFVNLGRREDARRTVDAIIGLIDDQGTRQRLREIPEMEVSRPQAPQGRTGSSGGGG